MMYKRPTLTKVPGDVGHKNEKESQGYIQDISKLNKIDLLELKARQELLLQNKARCSKLPDKGAKIKQFYERILKQLQIQSNIDRAADLLSELNIASTGRKTLTQMEWNDKYNHSMLNITAVDSDDELDDSDNDPLKVLAQSTHTKKEIVIEKPEPSLITDQDLSDIREFQNASANKIDCMRDSDKPDNALKNPNQKHSVSSSELFDGHSVFICKKISNTNEKSKFLPFKTTKSNVHDPAKEKQRVQLHGKLWNDNTAATPPSILHMPAKVLSLEESIILQEEKNKKLLEAKQIHAEERLKRRDDIKEKVLDTIRNDVMCGSIEFTTYRDVSDSEEELSDDNEDVKSDLELQEE